MLIHAPDSLISSLKISGISVIIGKLLVVIGVCFDFGFDFGFDFVLDFLLTSVS